ncbi:MAG: AAA family ATPase [Fusobacteriaceae bacterium]
MVYKILSEKTYFNLEFNIELEKDKNIYCFIGENGVGKTKLLETMCNGYIYGHEVFNRKDKNSILSKVKISNELRQYPISLPLKILINDLQIRENNENWGVTKIELIASSIKEYFKYPFAYIGTKNRGYAPNIEDGNIKLIADKISRFQNNILKSLKSLNRESINDISVAEWFVSRIITLNNPLIINSENIVKELKLICSILKELEPVKLKSLISEDTNSLNLFINENKLYFNGIPFEALSTGYMAIIKICQEIIETYGSWDFENSGEYGGEALFFIDELEAHLHPKWESRFIAILRKFFPKATFYIATHSPVVLGSIEEGEGYELMNIEGTVVAKKLGNPRNWYLADVYSHAFHLDNFFDMKEEEKEKTKDKFEKFSELVKLYMKEKNQNLKIEIENLYEEILKTLSEDDPRSITLNNLYRLLK